MAHRRHHHRRVARPVPGLLVPAQRGTHLILGGFTRQALGRCAALGHFDRQRSDLAALRQFDDKALLQPLVLGGIVLLAKQDDVGREQRRNSFRQGAAVRPRCAEQQRQQHKQAPAGSGTSAHADAVFLAPAPGQR